MRVYLFLSCISFKNYSHFLEISIELTQNHKGYKKPFLVSSLVAKHAWCCCRNRCTFTIHMGSLTSLKTRYTPL